MGAAIEKLISDGELYEPGELQQLQLQGASERLQEQRGAIKALDHRAREAGVETVSSTEDLIPLLSRTPPTRPTPRHLSRKENGD